MTTLQKAVKRTLEHWANRHGEAGWYQELEDAYHASLSVVDADDANAEAKGIQAIIYLQSRASIKETEESARREWRKMTPKNRAKTMEVFYALAPSQR